MNEILCDSSEHTSAYDQENDSQNDHQECTELDLRKADFIDPSSRRYLLKEEKACGSVPWGTSGLGRVMPACFVSILVLKKYAYPS